MSQSRQLEAKKKIRDRKMVQSAFFMAKDNNIRANRMLEALEHYEDPLHWGGVMFPLEEFKTYKERSAPWAIIWLCFGDYLSPSEQ